MQIAAFRKADIKIGSGLSLRLLLGVRLAPSTLAPHWSFLVRCTVLWW